MCVGVSVFAHVVLSVRSVCVRVCAGARERDLEGREGSEEVGHG